MGRTKYSEEDRLRIITGFVRCTREIIDMEGVEHVSIRRVAQCAGFNSATLYLYFKDADELITLSSMSYLENYCRTLNADIPHLKTPLEIYRHTWNIFSQHAFAHPQIFYRLFFYPHSLPLSQTVAKYYQIYPAQLTGTDRLVQEMLLEGDLKARNLKVLRPLAESLGYDEAHTAFINDMTSCYFKMLLEDHLNEAGTILAEQKTKKMLDAVDFLLRSDRTAK